jgi:hypothetical protein
MKTRDIQTKPFPDLTFIAFCIPNLQRYAGGIFQPPGPGHGVLAHSPVQIRGSFRTKSGDKAGFSFSRLRIAGKNNNSIADCRSLSPHHSTY